MPRRRKSSSNRQRRPSRESSTEPADPGHDYRPRTPQNPTPRRGERKERDPSRNKRPTQSLRERYQERSVSAGSAKGKDPRSMSSEAPGPTVPRHGSASTGLLQQLTSSAPVPRASGSSKRRGKRSPPKALSMYPASDPRVAAATATAPSSSKKSNRSRGSPTAGGSSSRRAPKTSAGGGGSSGSSSGRPRKPGSRSGSAGSSSRRKRSSKASPAKKASAGSGGESSSRRQRSPRTGSRKPGSPSQRARSPGKSGGGSHRHHHHHHHGHGTQQQQAETARVQGGILANPAVVQRPLPSPTKKRDRNRSGSGSPQRSSSVRKGSGAGSPRRSSSILKGSGRKASDTSGRKSVSFREAPATATAAGARTSVQPRARPGDDHAAAAGRAGGATVAGTQSLHQAAMQAAHRTDTRQRRNSMRSTGSLNRSPRPGARRATADNVRAPDMIDMGLFEPEIPDGPPSVTTPTATLNSSVGGNAISNTHIRLAVAVHEQQKQQHDGDQDAKPAPRRRMSVQMEGSRQSSRPTGATQSQQLVEAISRGLPPSPSRRLTHEQATNGSYRRASAHMTGGLGNQGTLRGGDFSFLNLDETDSVVGADSERD